MMTWILESHIYPPHKIHNCSSEYLFQDAPQMPKSTCAQAPLHKIECYLHRTCTFSPVLQAQQMHPHEFSIVHGTQRFLLHPLELSGKLCPDNLESVLMESKEFEGSEDRLCYWRWLGWVFSWARVMLRVSCYRFQVSITKWLTPVPGTQTQLLASAHQVIVPLSVRCTACVFSKDIPFLLFPSPHLFPPLFSICM